MALRATIGADFGEFTQALKSVELRLKDTGDLAKNAGRDLSRMVEGFSGSAVMRQADLIAEGLRRVEQEAAKSGRTISGVSTLTESEQRKVNAAVTEAIAKYKALGQQVPPDLQRIADETAKVGSATTTATSGAGGLMGKLGPLGPMIATTFSVGAVVAFGKEILATADATVKMADKTGMSIEAVQRLGYIAGQSGNTLDQVSASVSMLQKRLAEGDQSAVGALRQLGVEQERFMAMAPDQQFLEVARAVRDIEDPMQRARVATELFGRAGTELLPTLIADVDELADKAPVMSAKATKAFDDIGDSIARVTAQLKVMVGEGVATAMDAYGRLATGAGQLVNLQFAKAAETFLDLGTTLPKVTAQAKPLEVAVTSVALSMEEADRIGKELTKSVTAQTVATKAAEPPTRTLAQLLADLGMNASAASPKITTLGGQLVGLGQSAKSALPFLGWAGENPNGTLASTALFDKTIVKLGDVTDALTTTGDATEQVETSWRTHLGQATDVVDLLSRSAEMAGHTTTASLLSAASATAKAFATGGPWAAAMTAASGLLTTFWSKLFGSAEAKKDYAATDQIKVLQAELLRTYGSLEAIARAGGAAGRELVAAWGDRSQAGLKHFQELLDQFNAKVADSREELASLQQQLADRTVMDFERAQEIIERYGGTLDNLGQSFTAAKLAADWKSIWDDWQTLIDMGGDVGGVLVSMKDEIGALVAESIKIGTEIPAQFKPLIEELIRTGQLLGDNGEAITDIGQLQFGAPLVSEVDKIIAKIDELIAALTTGLQPALANLGTPVPAPWADWEAPSIPGVPTGPYGGDYGAGYGGQIYPQAAGGDYIVTRPTLFLAGEAGVERATFSGAGRTEHGGSTRPVEITLTLTSTTNLDGKEVARNQVRYLPNQLALAGV